MRKFICLVLFGVGLGLASLYPSFLLAQDYPNRSIEFVVPFAESSLASEGFKILAEDLEERWEQEMRIAYKPGDKRQHFWRDIDSIIDDGYTYAQFRTPEYFLLPLMGKADYDIKDQQPVLIYQCESHALFIRQNSSVRDFKKLLKILRRDGDIAEISGQGLGTWSHVTHLKLIDMLALPTVYRAFDKQEQARQAVRDEEALAYWGRAEEALGEGIEGLKVIALAAEVRHPLLPYIALFKENDVDLMSADCWGLMLPETTDSKPSKLMSREVAKVHQEGTYRQEVYKLGLEPYFVNSQQVSDYLRREQKNARKLLTKYGFIKE